MGPKKNNPNKNRDSLYGDCPVPVGSPRDTNVEWYPLIEISDGTQFFSYGIESTKRMKDKIKIEECLKSEKSTIEGK